ncbi:glycosyltransferase family 2 protein [Salegentibacter chungangensis]|uniref:Glycosyltransferase family 2 protein n=1 Tax=Salegentibacter chungangensis TaxID=1335724 RepID=A0ABW3NS99_9FLAO
MKFSLIICTFKRPRALMKLLNSVKEQILYPDEILIIDGSPDDETETILKAENFSNLKYYRVDAKNRGLTKQRNYGISKIGNYIDIICFLDDDIILTPSYFKNLIATYHKNPKAIGVGGYIIEDTEWHLKSKETKSNQFEFDGFVRDLGSRHFLRKKMRLHPNVPPGYMPDFSNGYSISFLPPSGNTYTVESFMGGVASYRKELFKKINFSTYFKGYGLYEDMDFCLRASKLGQLYVNTAAKLYHEHDNSGRPNRYKYGKMVIKNGWYVWRVKYSDPSFNSTLKWHATAFLLTLIRFSNVLTTSRKKEALTESLGRVAGWWGLLIKKSR